VSIPDGGEDGLSISAVVNSDAFRNSVIGILVTWVVKNVFLDPAAIVIGIIEWVSASVLSGLDAGLRGALSTAGGAVWNAFLGPSGVITALQEAMIDAATSAGIASPVAAGIVNLTLVVIVIGGTILLARAAAGYLTGGVAA
jgi:hypothetical protein